MKSAFSTFAAQYKNALLNDVLPFWQQYAIDWQQGGYFTCLNRNGSVYDTDKFVWLQNRQVWVFSMLYNRLEPREDWLKIAAHGTHFLATHGRDSSGNWYFSLDRAGQPLTQPYSIFSDCFAAMAFSQYALASGEDWAQEIALQSYQNVLRRQTNPKGVYSKIVPGSRPMKALAVPMILANLSLEMAWLLPPDQLDQVLTATVSEVMGDFLDPDRGLLYEHVTPDGHPIDCFEGRVINPGHGIEAMWFLMDIADRRGDTALVHRATEVILSTLAWAWDQDYGGLYYFLDVQGHPPQQLEWNQKLWWVHLESLVALAMAYRLTGREECWQWYQKLHDYTWSHFPDPEHGEWFGYLDRRGEVLLSLKGGKWKGCFHVPRALYLCWQQFQALATDSAP